MIVYLDDILIYTEDNGQAYVNAVRWVLNKLRKHGLFANLKKCRFHKNEVRFLSYVMSAQRVKMEGEQIEVVKNWPEPKLIRDIQVFLGFANFYRRFIQSFSKIAGPLTSMLRTSSATRLSKNSLLLLDVAEVDEVGVGGGGDCEDKMVGISPSKNLNGATGYLTPDTRRAFTQLRQVFTEAPILQHFDLQCHIRIETDVSIYAIGGVLS